MNKPLLVPERPTLEAAEVAHGAALPRPGGRVAAARSLTPHGSARYEFVLGGQESQAVKSNLDAACNNKQKKWTESI